MREDVLGKEPEFTEPLRYEGMVASQLRLYLDNMGRNNSNDNL